MTSQDSSASSRRTFLQTSSTVVGATLGALAVPRGVHAEGAKSDILKVGIVGCGGRGGSAVENAFHADARCELTAMGDAFADQLQRKRRQLGKHPQFRVDDDHCFVGFDAYRNVIDSGIDVLILATPPHFRPEHFEYAVQKGVHCFVEKPVAVDAPGVRQVMRSVRQAREKGLSVVSGLCWRYDYGVRETMRRIHDGFIGDVASIQSDYLTGTLWHRGDKPDWSRMEYQLRNWLYYTWLSGDHICEQHIHSLDKVMWLMHDEPPVAAVGMGGRIQRTGEQWGNIYDHFATTFEFANGVRAHCNCRQNSGCENRVDEYVTGTNGHALVLAHDLKTNDGRHWKWNGAKPSMYDVEHEALFESIRSGNPRNDGDYMAKSTMLAIMGRMAAYTGQRVTWEQCLASEQRLGPDSYAWGDAPDAVVAIPGKTPFV